MSYENCNFSNCGANFQAKCRFERVHADKTHLNNEFQKHGNNEVIDLKNIERDGCLLFSGMSWLGAVCSGVIVLVRVVGDLMGS